MIHPDFMLIAPLSGASVQFSPVAQSCLTLCDPMNRSTPLSITNSRSPTDSIPLSWWCYPTILSSVVPFSSCPHSFPASGSCQMSPFFTLGVQSIGVSASTSVLPMNTQDWSPLGWTGWISLQSKGLSRVFLLQYHSSKHQFFWAQLSLWSNSHQVLQWSQNTKQLKNTVLKLRLFEICILCIVTFN